MHVGSARHGLRNPLRRALALAAALSALLLAHASPALATTHVSSNITSNTTWTTSGSPYVIDPSGGISVTSGAQLTINAGVVVKFAGGHSAKLNMNGGKLYAVGTAGSPITFTSIKDDSVAGDTGGDGATTGTAGDFTGLSFANSGANSGLTSTLAYVNVTYGGYAGDQLTSTSDGTTSTSYSYDNNGRETGKGSSSFGYDMAGDLTSATIGSTTSYGYDGKGNRLSASDGTNTTNYSWDENARSGVPQLALETNGSSSLIRRYLYDSTGPLELQTASASYTDLQDNHGSVAALSNGGTIAATYSYEPFGTRTVSGGSPPTNPLGFQGQYQDAATGLFDLRARQYDSGDGRFLAPDPLAPALTDPYVSAYVFANDAPTMFQDPTGMSICLSVCETAKRLGSALYDGTKVIVSGTVAFAQSIAESNFNCVSNVFSGEMRDATRHCLKAAAFDAVLALPGGLGLAADEGIGGGLLERLLHEERGSLFGDAAAEGEFVDFAHGTTLASGRSILANGLSEDVALSKTLGARSPGSFFTVRVDPADPDAAIETAAAWGSRHGGDVCVVMCRLPATTVTQLERRGLLEHTEIPYQLVFHPGSFEIVNSEARWTLIGG